MFAAHPIGLPVPRSPSERLAWTIDALCREVAAYAVRDRAFQVFVLLLWKRLQRVKRSFAVLAEKLQAGTLRAPSRHPRPVARSLLPAIPVAPSPVLASRALQSPVLPRRFGWVARWVPGAATFGSQLRALLDDPEMQALLRAAPQAARLLRPLAHMLAVRPLPEVLRPAPRPAPSRPAAQPSRAVPVALAALASGARQAAGSGSVPRGYLGSPPRPSSAARASLRFCSLGPALQTGIMRRGPRTSITFRYRN